MGTSNSTEESSGWKAFRLLVAAANAILLLPCGCFSVAASAADVGAYEHLQALSAGLLLGALGILNLIALLVSPQGRSLAVLGWATVVFNGLTVGVIVLMHVNELYPFQGTPWRLLPLAGLSAITVLAVLFRR